MIEMSLVVVSSLAMFLSFFNDTFRQNGHKITRMGWVALFFMMVAFYLSIVKQENDLAKDYELAKTKAELQDAQDKLDRRILATDLMQKADNCDMLKYMKDHPNAVRLKSIELWEKIFNETRNKDLTGECK